MLAYCLKNAIGHYNEFDDQEITEDFSKVDVAIIKAQFGVAKNGAVWLTEKDMKFRVLPFICQHLALVLKMIRLYVQCTIPMGSLAKRTMALEHLSLDRPKQRISRY